MSKQKTQQSYSAYFKAAFATVFTISSFLIAKSTGYLFESPFTDEDSKVDENRKSAVDLRRSEETSNQIVNQETPQSLQLINSTAAGKFTVPNLQNMIIKNNIA